MKQIQVVRAGSPDYKSGALNTRPRRRPKYDIFFLCISTADVDETWSIDEATKKLQATSKKRNEWPVAFKEGVDLNHQVIQETFGEPAEEDFVARYDLSFLTPRSQAIRCKVLVLANL